MVLEGVDVSLYQGLIDWPTVRRAGIAFAGIKATEGLTFHDPLFPRNWRGARHAGITRIAYHFLHPGWSGAAQAHFLHAYVHQSGGFKDGDLIMLDVEVQDGTPGGKIETQIDAFVRTAWQETGRNVAIYTGTYFWRDVIGASSSPAIRQCPIWIASWTADGKPTSHLIPEPPAPWTVLSFWQYSATGRVPGIPADVDKDRFFGDKSQLRALSHAPKSP